MVDYDTVSEKCPFCGKLCSLSKSVTNLWMFALEDVRDEDLYEREYDCVFCNTNFRVPDKQFLAVIGKPRNLD